MHVARASGDHTHLPELGTNLVTALATLDVDDLAARWGKGGAEAGVRNEGQRGETKQGANFPVFDQSRKCFREKENGVAPSGADIRQGARSRANGNGSRRRQVLVDEWESGGTHRIVEDLELSKCV